MKELKDRVSAEDKAFEVFADLMIEKIESISEDWHKPWFTEGAMGWPRNLTDRKYNGMNAFMLMLLCEKKGYSLPYFCTFHQVQEMNEVVKTKDLPKVSVLKGEKSFPVMFTSFTCVHKTTKEKIKYEDYKKLSPEEQDDYAVYPRMQVFHVFNVAQTNLAEARPELWAKLEAENTPPQITPGEDYSLEAVDKMIRDNLWICPIRPKYQDQAYFSVAKNEIIVPEKGQFKTGQAFYGTLFHEMTHSTGRSDVLDRFNPTKFGSDDYAREELVAEMGAALVAQHYGMSQHIKEDSCAYLKAWLGKLRESPRFIRTTLTDVKKATAMITQKVDGIALEIEQGKHEELTDGQTEKTEKTQQLELSFDEPAEDMEVRFNDALLNPQPLRDGVEFANVQRVFEETKTFQFSAPNRITSPRDVAYIFKQLEVSSVENAFAVLVKDHKPTVIHLAMGTFDMVMATVTPIIAADQHLQADEIYFIHNHPSGQLKASEADKNFYKMMRGVFGDRVQPGIIINTRSGKFGMFTDKTLGEEALVAGSESVYNIPTYSFTKQVFSKNYQEVGYVSKSNDIAAFLSGQRLGSRKKLSYMVLSASGEIQANVHTHYSRLAAADYFPLAKRIADDVITYGGNTVVTYGSCELKKQEVQELGRMLKIVAPTMAMASGGVLADHVNVKVDRQLAEPKYYYESAVEEGWALRESNAVYGKEPVDEIQGISLSRDEVKELVMDHVREVLSEADIDVTLVGVEVHGSRGRGTAQADSDLDVVIEYHGDMKEYGMFNALNEEPLYIEGVRVDINPIRPEETGTLAQYMERSRVYDANFKTDDANLTDEEREIVARAKADGTYLKAPNGQPTQLSPKQWAQVRTKAFKDWFGDWEKAARIEKLRDSKPIDNITGNEIEASEDWEQYKKNALNYGKMLRGEYTNKDTGAKISVNRQGIKEILHHDRGDAVHIQSIAAIPEIIENSIYIETIANEDTKKNPDIKEYQYLVSGLKLGNIDYTVKSVIGVDRKGNRYYDHALTQIEKGNLLDELARITSPASQKANPLSDIKDKRLLSILQTAASKVVNENGEPLVVYHGTTSDQETKIWDERTRSFYTEHGPFTIFKRRVDGEKNSGFFFSNNQDNAGGYGYNTYDTYLNLRNPLVIDAKGANYTDVKYDGTRRDTYEWAGYAEKNGFDGVVFRNISDGVDMRALTETNTDYVAFSSNQIKSATDNAGTFDVKNEDIRYRFAGEMFDAPVSVPSSMFTEILRQEIDEAIEDLEDKLGVPVAVEDSTTPNGKNQQFAGEKGWFVPPNAQNPNGTVHVNVDNHVSVNDVTQTVLHEVVGHKGLRAVVGKKAFDTLCESVYRSMPLQEQQVYLRRYGSRTVAGEEYMATLAEQDTPHNTPIWAKVITAVKVALNSIGIQVDYNAAEMQELLRRSTRQLDRSLKGAIKKVPVKVNGVKLDKWTRRQLALGRSVVVGIPDKKTGKGKTMLLSWDEKQQKLTGRPPFGPTNGAPRHKM